jgi:hypothetical protein
MFVKEVEIKSPVTAHILSGVLDLLVALQYLGPSENLYCLHKTHKRQYSNIFQITNCVVSVRK